MNLKAIETVVRRVMADPAFRAAIAADPKVALAEYRLTADERGALGKLAALPNLGAPLPVCGPGNPGRVWWC